ncbi:conjugal transfer protein TrbL family protein [Paenibacillus hubeiensis]|uniref:conjugal transfer protein TrbL family protein n=1 Tax=Paenibacillus hubeiensis TaxID=3077330 RepID=UPI0031BA2EA8
MRTFLPAWNPISNLIEEAIENWLTNLANSAINFYLELLQQINSASLGVLDMPVVVQGILLAQAIAGSLLAAKWAFEIWYNNILRNSGDSEADLQNVLINGAQAAAIIMSVPWIVRQVYAWGTYVASDVVALPGVDLSNMSSPVSTLLTGSMLQNGFPMATAIAVLFALVMLVVVLIQTFIRAGELAVAAVVGSFLALGLTNSNSQAFQGWWRELLNISLAQAIQMFLIKCSFFALLNFAAPAWVNVFLFCGFVWVTYKSPAILKQYVYSTGAGKALGGAAQQAGSMVMMRKLMTKGV